MKKVNCIILLGVLITAQACPLYPTPTTGYNINVRIDGLQDSTLYLAYHYGNRKYIKDTIKLDSSGSGVFKGDEALPGGIYLVVMPEMKYFEVLIDQEQNFSIETSMDEPLMSMEVKGSEESKHFNIYQKFMAEKQSASLNLQKRLELNRGDPDSVRYLNSVGKALDNEVNNYWNSIIDDYPGTLLANMISTMKIQEVPEFDVPKDTKNPDSLRWAMGYQYNKKHFFDLVDFSDERLLRTPVLHNKLEHYFTRTLIQRADSIIPEAIRVVELSRENDKVFQYVLVYLLNLFEGSVVMGLDEAFVELAERYYLSGEAFWVDEKTVSNLKEKVERIKPNLIGRTAAEMKMRTPEGNFIGLHETDAEYIIIYFYEPACGHCKVVTPRLNKLYDKYRDQGLKIFAVYIYDDIEEWKEYISSNNLDWINVFDPRNETYFRHYYDVYSTPTMYIVDSDKTIIAKRIGIETIEQMIEELL